MSRICGISFVKKGGWGVSTREGVGDMLWVRPEVEVLADDGVNLIAKMKQFDADSVHFRGSIMIWKNEVVDCIDRVMV